MGEHARAGISVALLVVATIGGALSVGELIDAGSWLPPSLVVLGAAATVLLVARRLFRATWLPTVLAGAAGVYVLAAMFTVASGALAPLPGLSAPGQMIDLVRQGAQDAATTEAPVVDSEGLALSVAGALLLVLLLSELLAVGCRAPVWSGLALLAPWIPAAALGASTSAWAFIMAAGGYLGLLVVDATERFQRENAVAQQHVVWRSTVWAAVPAILIALIAAPAVLHVPVSQWQGPGGGGTGATRLDLGLDVSDHLQRGSDVLLYTYRASEPDRVGPLHAYTVTDFDGQRWHHDEEPGPTTPVDGDQVLWPDQVEAGPVDHTLEMNVLELGQDRLLLPGQPRILTIDGEWAYDPGADEVIGSGPTPLQYEVGIIEPDLDPVAMSRAGVAEAGAVDPATLDVPDTGYQEQIQALTERVTAGASTPYEQAVAIQDHLRTDSHFNYDVEVDPARTSDAVWDFLGSGRGYCVQFATAMVVMARTMDIPARMAVGFLEGEEGTEGRIEVSGHRAHTWPQLYFEDAGWVRFEPTPPERTGTAPQWATGLPEDAPAPPEDVPETGLEPVPEQGEAIEAPEPETEATETGSRPEDGAAWWPWVVMAALGGALIVLAIRYRRRHADDVEGSWRRVRKAAQGVRPEQAHPGETPRGLAARLALSGAAGDALARLVRAVEEHRYAPAGRPRPAGAQLRHWRAEVLRAIRQRDKQPTTRR